MASWSIKSLKSESAKLKPLLQSFYERDTLVVARELLGKLLVVRQSRAGKELVRVGRIVETEAYHGDDPASHSARGITPRSAIMFGEPGLVYVYFIYGMYEMLNFVTEKKGYPGAVLIRGLEPVFGIEEGAANGPGKLCRALGIKLSDNGQSLQGPRFQVLDDGYRSDAVMSSPRVGIRVAAEKPWRFFIEASPGVSRAKQNREGLRVR